MTHVFFGIEEHATVKVVLRDVVCWLDIAFDAVPLNGSKPVNLPRVKTPSDSALHGPCVQLFSLITINLPVRVAVPTVHLTGIMSGQGCCSGNSYGRKQHGEFDLFSRRS
ncbi:hypothetical protein Ct61P_07323 [Colletotrichum tofieldiae]|nr:hypothetical protein Ct61P_07323 [Colletotrichum tofieldiae]